MFIVPDDPVIPVPNNMYNTKASSALRTFYLMHEVVVVQVLGRE